MPFPETIISLRGKSSINNMHFETVKKYYLCIVRLDVTANMSGILTGQGIPLAFRTDKNHLHIQQAITIVIKWIMTLSRGTLKKWLSFKCDVVIKKCPHIRLTQLMVKIKHGWKIIPLLTSYCWKVRWYYMPFNIPIQGWLHGFPVHLVIATLMNMSFSPRFHCQNWFSHLLSSSQTLICVLEMPCQDQVWCQNLRKFDVPVGLIITRYASKLMLSSIYGYKERQTTLYLVLSSVNTLIVNNLVVY